MIDKHPIIGGHEVGGVLYIGRISSEGDIKIGKVCSFLTENALTFFNSRDTEKSVASYEILMYNENALEVKIEKK